VYALASSKWCKTGGNEGSPEHATAPQALGFTDGAFHTASVTMTGLTAGLEYCAELVAENGSGSGSLHVPLRFIAGAPSGTTGLERSPVSTSPTSVTIEAEVNPAGQTTHYQLAYGLASSNWCTSGEGSPEHTTALTTLGFTDGAFHKIIVEVGGLSPSKEYCAVLVITNPTGAAQGSEAKPLGTGFTAGAPGVRAIEVSPGSTGATVEGEVDPAEQTTHYKGEYSLASSKWCTSVGFEGSPEHATGSETLAFTDSSFHRVKVEVGGLSPETEYCAALVAENASSTTKAEVTSFTTGPASPSPPLSPPGDGGGNGGNTGGPTGHVSRTPASTLPAPALGARETIGVVSGTVTFRVKGAATFVPLSATSSMPDGSEVDATNGRVTITAVGPHGEIVTAEVYGGRFRVHQDPSGETHFILTLPLTGCPRVALPTGSAAAYSARHHSGPKSRHLWVSEKGGRWGTNGRFVSTSVEGTIWLTLDECSRSQVKVAQGKVKVRDLVKRKTKTITAGKSYTALAKRHP
jgi:hypothetical protein